MTPAGLPTVLSTDEPRRPISRAAVVGLLASLAWIVSYLLLPWITFTPAQRERVRVAYEPEISALELRDPETAQRYRGLLRDIAVEGAFTGRDLHRYARAAGALNRTLEGDAPVGARDRPWVVQRAFPVVAAVLAALPAAAAVLVLLLLLRGLRSPSSLALAGLIVVGMVGSGLALAWERWADSLASDVLRGSGLSTALVASLAQASAGLFGVKARTWWKAYLLAAVVLVGLAWGAWAHVMHGWAP